MHQADEDLVRRAVAGERRPFAVLVDRYYAVCLRFALRQLGNRADAEEAVQDAFLRAYRALPRCTPGRFRPWLMTILVRRCRSYGSRRQRREARLMSLEEAPSAVAVEGHANLADDIAGTPADMALRKLSPVLREAFLLKYVEELTYEEIARLTGAGVSAVKMRVKRAGEALARSLEAEHG